MTSNEAVGRDSSVPLSATERRSQDSGQTARRSAISGRYQVLMVQTANDVRDMIRSPESVAAIQEIFKVAAEQRSRFLNSIGAAGSLHIRDSWQCHEVLIRADGTAEADNDTLCWYAADPQRLLCLDMAWQFANISSGLTSGRSNLGLRCPLADGDNGRGHMG